MDALDQHELLTHTGPETPGGEMLRRYWQPVALSEELPIGGAPLPLRIMSEDLVLFRDEGGQVGLLGIHCAHRGADLSYGRLEDGGLRCIYHGWLYDVHGRCLEQPGEPAGSTFHQRIRHTAYPCVERGGLVLAYLGPGAPPLVPNYEFLGAGLGYCSLIKVLNECNYLQAYEGDLDPSHQSFLHRLGMEMETDVHQVLNARATAPTIETEDTVFGARIYAVRAVPPDLNNVRVSYIVLPNIAAVSGRKDGYTAIWHVPIDDTSHWRFQFQFSRTETEVPPGVRRGRQAIGPDYRLGRTRANRYLQDREEMKSQSFAGLGPNFLHHDFCAVEGAGPIQDRSQEHLGYADRAIIKVRQLLTQAIYDVQAGRDPRNVIRDPAANDFAEMVVRRDYVLAQNEDWHRFWEREGVAFQDTDALAGRAH
jgi:phenylpropionate dioxygenase-like ring-hydroxylating dioxygenase large terminal subunit